MSANAKAMEHVRFAIEASEAMDAKSTAVLISDLKLLLQMAERAAQYDPSLMRDGSAFQTEVKRGYQRFIISSATNQIRAHPPTSDLESIVGRT
jgi:hypothetical protein